MSCPGSLQDTTVMHAYTILSHTNRRPSCGLTAAACTVSIGHMQMYNAELYACRPMNDTVTQQQNVRDITTTCRTLVLQINTCTINFILLNDFLKPRSVLIFLSRT